MCICLASRAHPDYALVLLSNRDEYLDRPTERAHTWPGTAVFGPRDLLKEEKGTWTGLSSSGRFAVVLNFHETDDPDAPAPISRGAVCKNYLLSDQPTDEWIAATEADFGDQLRAVGALSMICGQVRLGADGRVEPVRMLSNRQPDRTFLAADQPATFAASNGPIGAEDWTKVGLLETGFTKLLDVHGADFVSGVFDLLSTPSISSTAHFTELRRSVFIPRLEQNQQGHAYGTRTQTVILVGYDGTAQYIEKDLADGTVISHSISLWGKSSVAAPAPGAAA